MGRLKRLRRLLLAKRLLRGPLWFLLVNPRKAHALLIRAVAWTIFRLLGLGGHWGGMASKLPSSEWGLPWRNGLFVRVPRVGKLYLPRDSSPIVVEQFMLLIYDWFVGPRPGWVVVDAGAHAGVFSVKTAKRLSRGKVIAVEPHPENFRHLRTNIKLNQLNNVIAVNTALWGERARLKLCWDGRHSDTPKVLREDASMPSSLDIEAITLDDLMEKLNLKRVDMIKIDVEGAELDVLKGAEEILRNGKPILSIAAYHWSTEASEIAEFLEQRGFRTFVIDMYVYAIKQ